MKPVHLATLAILLAATSGAHAQAANAIPPNARLTPVALGPVRIGMSEAEVSRVLGVTLEGEELTEGCRETGAPGLDGIGFMFESDRLTRITLSDPSRITTPRGIGIGATEAEVRAAYGSGLQSETHEYVGEPARYLTYWLRPNASGVRFETNAERRVELIHAGTNSINYIEGCL